MERRVCLGMPGLLFLNIENGSLLIKKQAIGDKKGHRIIQSLLSRTIFVLQQ